MSAKVHIDSLVELTSLLGTDLIQVQRTTLALGNQDRKATLTNLAALFSLSSLLADGSAAAPALKFANSPATGLFSPGADSLGWSIAGTQRLSLAPAGGAVHSQLTLDGQFVWGNGFGVLYSDGHAGFSGGVVNVSAAGVDIAETIILSPDGSATFASLLCRIGADGSVRTTKVFLKNLTTGNYIPLTCFGPDAAPQLDFGTAVP